MKYFYIPSGNKSPDHGVIKSVEGLIFRHYTLFEIDNLKLGVIQQKFDPISKCCWWDHLDPELANDIYENPKFNQFFIENASEDLVIFRVRQLMWALRMKPIKREEWEEYFS